MSITIRHHVIVSVDDLALVQFRTGPNMPKPDGKAHSHMHHRAEPCMHGVARISSIFSVRHRSGAKLGLIAEYPNKFVGKCWHANPTYCSPYMYTLSTRNRRTRTCLHTNSIWSYAICVYIRIILVIAEAYLTYVNSCPFAECACRSQAIVGNGIVGTVGTAHATFVLSYRWTRHRRHDLRAIDGNVGTVGTVGKKTATFELLSLAP